jgi:hypothetical protein
MFNDELFFDISQKIEGHGHYVCYDLNCINNITSKKKKIKANFTFNKLENLERLKVSLINYILKMFNIFYLNKNIVVGVSESLLNYNNLKYIITSSDISDSSFKKIKKSDDDDKILDYIDITSEQLGKVVNRTSVVALGLRKIDDLNFKRVLSQYKILFSQE